MNIRLLGSAMIASIALCGPAMAQTYTYGFKIISSSGDVSDAMGTFTASSTSTPGLFDINSVTGSATGPSSTETSMITGLSTYAGADNQIYIGKPYVDQDGISFITAAGTDFNLYFDPTDSLDKVTNSINDPGAGTPAGRPDSADSTVSVDVFPVSAVSSALEPSTWGLLLGGVGILGGMLRLATARRREDMASA